jgi:hypothetical protein
MTTEKRRVRCLGHFDGDPLENLLGWAEPDLNATVEGRWLRPAATDQTDRIRASVGLWSSVNANR